MGEVEGFCELIDCDSVCIVFDILGKGADYIFNPIELLPNLNELYFLKLIKYS